MNNNDHSNDNNDNLNDDNDNDNLTSLIPLYNDFLHNA